MTIDLNSFEREKAIDETLSAETLDLGSDIARTTGQVRIKGKVIKSPEMVELAGELTGSVEIVCDRCLKTVQRPFAIGLDLEFVPTEQFDAEASLELHSDDMKLDAITDDRIDLAEIAKEQILLDLPQQFFCKDDCRGLCEKCGANLNLKDCDCKDDEIDPRWAGLKDLK